jgi:hypothetical protein
MTFIEDGPSLIVHQFLISHCNNKCTEEVEWLGQIPPSPLSFLECFSHHTALSCSQQLSIDQQAITTDT